MCCAGLGESEGAGGRERKERRTDLPIQHAWSLSGSFRSLCCQEMGCELWSCSGASTSATLCPQSTWASGQCILSHCHALAGKLPKEISPSPPKPEILGDLLYHAMGKYHILTTSPSYRSTNLLFPPQLTLVSVPQDSGVMIIYCSSYTAVHQEPQMAALPSFSMQSQ